MNKDKDITKFQYFLFTFIGVFIFALIIWPLMDWIISRKTFHYSVVQHIIVPLIFAIIYSAIDTFIKIRKIKKSK